METTSSDQRRLADKNARERVEHLLGRYPEISIEETSEILRFLKKGPFLEVGLLTSNDGIKPKLEQFRADHAREFSMGPKSLMIAALLILLIVATVAFLWNAGAGR